MLFGGKMRWMFTLLADPFFEQPDPMIRTLYIYVFEDSVLSFIISLTVSVPNPNLYPFQTLFNRSFTY
ncbi:hypothetical protein HanRHA438_Chr03g0108001 [Helianthus annuus]|nr:hypothetical protein HanIR_Chr03g0105761 [Helianthus annuus]KAJ0607072.1 hypothetical protein HanHA89_Chr03g0092291 [Helianthus annuus]KAJ0772980.1 hypothetical protein HanOQP8_Chr03g0093641 [Helianthus annuus]KAJ0934489.1 hypothetical protein HanRHA438_Chr03g0108001 [Helianthus annuus]